MNYYLNQLKKLENFEVINIQLSDYEGNKTNSMSLNHESIQVLREFLDKVEAELENNGVSK